MKTKHYLLVKCFYERRNTKHEFTLKESSNITYVLKNLSDDGKCEIELIECSIKEYKKKFG